MSEQAESNSANRLVFMMGEYRAEFPCDRLYAKNHMWAIPNGGSGYRFGLTAYAVRLLQDVYFLDWDHDPGTRLKLRQNIGSIESKKAESDLFAPLSGVLTDINSETLDDPSAINVDCYGDGWLFEMDANGATELQDPNDYLKHLEAAWEVAQRTIKGQVNQ